VLIATLVIADRRSTYHQHRQAWAAVEGEVVVEEPACCRTYVVCLVALSGEVVSRPSCESTK
jgi:hypothetical protein